MRAWPLLLILAAPARAQDTVPLDLATSPRPNGPIPVMYPVREADRNQEGWVMLDFMIDPNGKTYEIAVVDSTGSKHFEAAAVKAAQRWTFEPAMLHGKPIDTSYHFKLYFDHPYAKGVRKEFAKEYETAVAAVAAEERLTGASSLSYSHVRVRSHSECISVAGGSEAADRSLKPHTPKRFTHAIRHASENGHSGRGRFR